MARTLKPGSPTPNSGIYVERGPRGGQTNIRVTSVEHRPLPPTSKPGATWQPDDLAHPKTN